MQTTRQDALAPRPVNGVPRCSRVALSVSQDYGEPMDEKKRSQSNQIVCWNPRVYWLFLWRSLGPLGG